MKRLSMIVGMLMLVGLAASSAQAGNKPIDVSKFLIRTANPGALKSEMPDMPGMPQGGFPNNYTSSVTATFDPNAGSAGTLHFHYHFTGTTLSSLMQQNPGAKHFPNIELQVVNNGVNKSYHAAGGRSYGIAPNAQMNYNFDIAFDLGSDGCTLDYLEEGGVCTITEVNDNIQCTVAGEFLILFNTFQMEGATSETQTVTPILPYPQAPWCGDTSDPPDFYIKTSATNPTGYFTATAHLIRFQAKGRSFSGIPWLKLDLIGLAFPVPAGPKPICTQYDKGCRWGAMFCTGSPNGPETRLIPKPTIRQWPFEWGVTVVAIGKGE